jgi:hypothetical protein
MVFVQSGPSYKKTTSPLFGTSRTPFTNTCSSRTYVRHSSPFFGRSYSSPCQAPYRSSFYFQPFFRPYTPPVVFYDNNPPVIVNDNTYPHSTSTLGNVIAITAIAIVAIALLNSALTRQEICTMGRDCEEVLDKVTGYYQTVCSDLYERCI